MTHAELEGICVAAAEGGAQLLRELFGRSREISFKGQGDLVTDGDRASEEYILGLLRERAPGTAILAEESGESGKGEVRFIVDPLDGTTNYAQGSRSSAAPWRRRRRASPLLAAPWIRCAAKPTARTAAPALS